MTNAFLRLQLRIVLVLLLALSPITPSANTAAGSGESKASQYRQWILEMKENHRGPFSAIKWFCKDGRVLKPKDYSCASKGQGWQHGEWSERTRQLRANGFKVATLLAGIDADKMVSEPEPMICTSALP